MLCKIRNLANGIYTAVVIQIILDINSYLINSFVLMISLSAIRRLCPKPSDISRLSSGLFFLQAWTSPLDLTKKGSSKHCRP